MSDQFHRLFAWRFIVILRRKDDGTIISDFCVMLLLHVKQYAGKSSSNFQNTPQIFTVYNYTDQRIQSNNTFLFYLCTLD